MGLRFDPSNPEHLKILQKRGFDLKSLNSNINSNYLNKINKELDKLDSTESSSINLKPKSSKFNNIRVEVDGEVYDSKWECRCHQELKILEKMGVISNLKRQVKFKFAHNNIEIWGCKLDFQFDKNGKTYVADSKTKSTTNNRIWKTNVKMLRAFKGIEVVLFYNDKDNRADVYSTVYNLV